MLNSSTLQTIWSLIETTSTRTILGKSDRELAQYLLTELEIKQPLNLQEYDSVIGYIYSKMTLRNLPENKMPALYPTVNCWNHEIIHEGWHLIFRRLPKREI